MPNPPYCNFSNTISNANLNRKYREKICWQTQQPMQVYFSLKGEPSSTQIVSFPPSEEGNPILLLI